MPIPTVCRAGVHDLSDPANVGYRVLAGREGWYCYACRTRARRLREGSSARARQRQLEWSGPHIKTKNSRTRARKRLGLTGQSNGQLAYQVSGQELATLQMLADGMTVTEIAEQLHAGRGTIISQLYAVRRKYGVATNPEAVAQGLKRGAVRPDKKTGKRLPNSHEVSRHATSLRQLVRGERHQYREGGRRLTEELDALMAWTEPHAVSVLWAAGRITSRHVPTTRNTYRGVKSRRERIASSAI